MLCVGIDTGGTFTDFALFDGHRVTTFKVLSTPASPESAILEGLRHLQMSDRRCRLVHGSTIATNAVLEGKGVRTAYITNRGLADTLTIGRQARPRLYDLTPAVIAPPVAPELCIETGGRLAPDGSVVTPLDAADLAALKQAIEHLRPRAVAINLLFSFVDDRFERMIEQALAPHLFVSRSSAVLPEYKEYERGITTWLNAYVGPLVATYLRRMETALPQASISVMQSAGTTCSAAEAAALAVRLLLSGPAGGLRGAQYIAGMAGFKRLLTLDMGGTSTDVAIVEKDIKLTSEGRIGRYPVAVPMVDMHTVGAGGGSLATVDSGGVLRVGPASAGADPGPACYAKGGRGATVTDANLVLGRIPPDTRLAGTLPLDLAAAQRALARLAHDLGGLSVAETARGIIRVVNENMAAALRVISVQQGLDPKEFVLVCFGGAGGLHVCDLADELNMRRALFPVHAGVLSALGMVASAPGRQLSRTIGRPWSELTEAAVLAVFDNLIAQGMQELKRDGVAPSACAITRSLDLCYRGQSFTLSIPWESMRQAVRAFHQAHERIYGHFLDRELTLVTARVQLATKPLPLALPAIAGGPAAAPDTEYRLHGIPTPVRCWSRARLRRGQTITGPAIVAEPATTVYVAAGWDLQVDEFGNLQLFRTSGV